MTRFFICVLGMVLIVEGLPYFAFPRLLKGMLLKVADMPTGHLRAMGFIAMAAGLFLVYLAQRTQVFY